MVERVLLGKHPDSGVVGLWVSKPTKNARTSTNLDDFLVHPDKINQRPFLRVKPLKFTRGEFVQTSTFADGSKADSYLWLGDIFHNFGYVPNVLITRGNVALYSQPWVDAAKIGIVAVQVYAYKYAASDPSKTPISGTYYDETGTTGARYKYNVADQTIDYIGADTMNTYSIYRNPIS